MLKTFLIFAIPLILVSCNKENPPKENTETQKNQAQEEDENNSDSTLTAEESFSSALVQDIIGENDDMDLQYYLEEQIYPLVSKSNKVTLDRISSSQYLLIYDENGVRKSILIQKYYNPAKEEIIFEKSETEFNAMKRFTK